jgi:6-phosphogluconolactonase (cycloisomerase 2 family)
LFSELLAYAQTAPEHIYAANENASSLTGYTVDQASGSLTAVSGSPFATGARPFSVAVDPSGRFLFTANQQGGSISVFTIDGASGQLAAVPGDPQSGLNAPHSITIDPTGRFAYVACGDGTVHVFSVDVNLGALTPRAQATQVGGIPYFVLVTGGGRFLYVATDGAIAGFSIDVVNGDISPVQSPVQFTDALWLASNPTSQFLYAMSDKSLIAGFTINPISGVLTPMAGSPFPTSPAGSPAMIIDPEGSFLYAADQQNENVVGVLIDSASGVLGGTVPGSPFPTGNYPDAFTFDPSGEFMYVANNSSGNVTGFSYTPGSGTLDPVPGSPFPAGAATRSIAAAPAYTPFTATPRALAIIPPSASLTSPNPGQTVQFSAEGLFSGGGGHFVTASATWSSSDPKVARVSNYPDAAGLVTIVGSGAAQITAQYGGLATQATVAVGSPVLISIALSPANFSVKQGTQVQYTATGTFRDGSEKDITDSVSWVSSNIDIATITASGLASSVSAGEVTISASLDSIIGSTTLTYQ